MFVGLEAKLDKVNNVFTKAMKQYEGLVTVAEQEVESSKRIISTAEANIKTSEDVKRKALNAIAGIKQIVGE